VAVPRWSGAARERGAMGVRDLRMLRARQKQSRAGSVLASCIQRSTVYQFKVQTAASASLRLSSWLGEPIGRCTCTVGVQHVRVYYSTRVNKAYSTWSAQLSLFRFWDGRLAWPLLRRESHKSSQRLSS